MRGVVLRPDGKPVVGLKVETVESSVETDENGDFGLYYKPPDTHVYFDWENAWYRRAYQEGDAGKRIEILLPPTRSLQVDCGDFTCRLTLDWEYGDGLLARRRGRCEAGESVVLDGSPQGVPAVSCQAKVTEPDLPLSTRMGEDLLELLPPARDIAVRVDGDAEAADCVVYADRVQLKAREDGRFVGSAAGDATVQAVCNGRAAAPVALADPATELEVAWMDAGPTLRPPPGMELDRLQLVQSGGWTLVLRATESGAFLLPVLPAGSYALQLTSTDFSPIPVTRPDDLQPGVVAGQMLSSGQYAAHLVLERDASDGVLEAGI